MMNVEMFSSRGCIIVVNGIEMFINSVFYLSFCLANILFTAFGASDDINYYFGKITEKKIERVTEYVEIINHVKSVNLKRKISAKSAKKNSYLPKTTTREQ
jgi:hypothetical protein